MSTKDVTGIRAELVPKEGAPDPDLPHYGGELHAFVRDVRDLAARGRSVEQVSEALGVDSSLVFAIAGYVFTDEAKAVAVLRARGICPHCGRAP